MTGAWHRRLAVSIFCLIVGLPLFGCWSDSPVEINRAELMPEPVAKQIIASIIRNYSGGDSLQIKDRIVPIRSIEELHLYTNQCLQVRPGSYTPVWVHPVSADEAKKLAEALTAMGANVSLRMFSRPVLGGCA